MATTNPRPDPVYPPPYAPSAPPCSTFRPGAPNLSYAYTPSTPSFSAVVFVLPTPTSTSTTASNSMSDAAPRLSNNSRRNRRQRASEALSWIQLIVSLTLILYEAHLLTSDGSEYASYALLWHLGTAIPVGFVGIASAFIAIFQHRFVPRNRRLAMVLSLTATSLSIAADCALITSIAISLATNGGYGTSNAVFVAAAAVHGMYPLVLRRSSGVPISDLRYRSLPYYFFQLY